MKRDWSVIGGAAALLAAVTTVVWVLDNFLGGRWAAFAFSMLWLAFGVWTYAGKK